MRAAHGDFLPAARRLPIGAECTGAGRVHFRVWATAARRVAVLLERGDTYELAPEGNGYFSGYAEAGPGARYWYRLDRGEPRPDPASRFQPEGPAGPSEVIDPSAYRWPDRGWAGPGRVRPVLYELHVGTFTAEGTWQAAAARLPTLAELGVSVLELMPVSAFPGRFGWGYDGVAPFAPTQLYGRPDDFRAFVAAAHGLGLGVILDVVYNHFGPAGCYLEEFSPQYFSERTTEWGAALNFDGPDSAPVREYFSANARYWVDEYHLDGLRLDATQSIFDSSEPNIIAEVVAAVRAAAPGRRTLVIAENEPQHTDLLRPPERGGCGVDAAWNDDFHHAARVALTGRTEAYYSDYRGSPQELLSAVRWGYLYQGQHYSWQRKRRGTPAFDLDTGSFVNFLQNHDQVANSAEGRRVHELTSPGLFRALTALLLLAPGIPMLFQGQEYAASTPFLFFADHEGELRERVAQGRREFLAQFPSIATPEITRQLADPGSPETFRRCVLDYAERERHALVVGLHRDLIALSRTPPFETARRATTEGAVLSDDCLALRFFGPGDSALDRLLLVNLGTDLHLGPLPEPLLAPPRGLGWTLAWSSEEPRYGGRGAPDNVAGEPAWRVPGRSAVVLRPHPEHRDRA